MAPPVPDSRSGCRRGGTLAAAAPGDGGFHALPKPPGGVLEVAACVELEDRVDALVPQVFRHGPQIVFDGGEAWIFRLPFAVADGAVEKAPRRGHGPC